MTPYLFIAFLATGIFNFICSILILRGLSASGIRVNFFEIRWQVHKHLKSYREINRRRHGRIAWPYYAYQASLVATIGFGLLALWSLTR